jgi:hypothetical protein
VGTEPSKFRNRFRGNNTLEHLDQSSRTRVLDSNSLLVYEVNDRTLTFYLALNTGGTPHAAEEIARIRAMREELAAK